MIFLNNGKQDNCGVGAVTGRFFANKEGHKQGLDLGICLGAEFEFGYPSWIFPSCASAPSVPIAIILSCSSGMDSEARTFEYVLGV